MIGFPGRVGAAIIAPRRALAIAGAPEHVGRSGSDLVKLLGLVLLATQLRWLAKAAWLGGAVDLSVGLRAAVHVLTGTFAVDLGVLAIATALIFALGQVRFVLEPNDSGAGIDRAKPIVERSLGRAFDLACVAVVPLLLVDLVVTIALHVLDEKVGGTAMLAASIVSYGWCAVIVLLARKPVLGVARREKLAGLGVIVLVLAGIVVEGVWISQNTELLRPMKDGEAAPAFSLPRIAQDGAHGPPLALGELRGKVVVLDFWETWCKPCLAGMPTLDLLQRKHGDELAVVTINMDDAKKARALFDQRGFALTLLADDFETQERYGVSTIPHTVVIDRSGIVRHVFRGGSTKLTSAVDNLVKQVSK